MDFPLQEHFLNMLNVIYMKQNGTWNIVLILCEVGVAVCIFLSAELQQSHVSLELSKVQAWVKT